MPSCNAGHDLQREMVAAQALAAFSRRPLAARLCVFLVCAIGVVAVGGCSFSEGPGTVFVDPGHYSVYHCNDLATRWKALLAREQELRNLMDKAGEGPAGALIGTLTYRSDYESVLTEKRLVQREAADKKCELVPAFQSDQTIR